MISVEVFSYFVDALPCCACRPLAQDETPAVNVSIQESNLLSDNFHEDPPAKILSNVKNKREKIQRKERRLKTASQAESLCIDPRIIRVTQTWMDGWTNTTM